MGTSRSNWEGRDVIVPLDPTWFTPNLPITAAIDDLGLLREIAKSPALIEPYSNPPTRDDLDTCQLKRLWIKEDERRKRGDGPYPEVEQPMLWVLASHISKPLLKDYLARKTRRVPGLYTLGAGQAFLNTEAVMAYPQAFLDWEEATKESSKLGQARVMVLRLLSRRCGELSPSVRSRIELLSLTQLEELGEDLLDFVGLADLQLWLDRFN